MKRKDIKEVAIKLASLDAFELIVYTTEDKK